MKTKKLNLVIVAHPDDETIFFGGLLIRKPYPGIWKVICVTDGNGDGKFKIRKKQFENACIKMGIKEFQQFNLPDLFEQRLDTIKLVQLLSDYKNINKVFTHNILGEYGHPHHQDVSYAVHKAFKNNKVYSTAYNLYPKFKIQLTQSEYIKKSKILTDVYGSETNRFLNFLPSTWCEGFNQIHFSEVESIYNFLIKKNKKLNTKHLNHFLWLESTQIFKSLSNFKRPF